MRWFDLRLWATFALATSACSDDGVPLDGGETDTAASASAGESADPSGGTSAVTTDSASDSAAGTESGATTDPTGLTDTDGTSGPSSSSGTSGEDSTGGGSSTGGTTEPECMVPEDCMLVDDCCSCTAIPVGEEPPKCDLKECLVSTCTSLGLSMPQVQCNFGSCEVEEVSCDPMLVLCDSLPPECPKGQAPRVMDGCWTDTCIPVEYCDVVPSCDACGEDEACIESGGTSLSCVPIPPECDGVPSCDCLGEACVDPFGGCEHGIDPKTGAEIACSE